MQDEMTLYKTQLIKIQKYLNVGGSFDSLKIETFANKVHMITATHLKVESSCSVPPSLRCPAPLNAIPRATPKVANIRSCQNPPKVAEATCAPDRTHCAKESRSIKAAITKIAIKPALKTKTGIYQLIGRAR